MSTSSWILVAVFSAVDATGAGEKISARLMALQNIIVEFDRQDVHSPNPVLRAKIEARNRAAKSRLETTAELKVGESSGRGRFAFLEGQARLEAFEGTSSKIAAHLSDRTEVFIQDRPDATARGVISNSQPLSDLGILDYALGLRLFGAGAWLTKEEVGQGVPNAVDDLILFEFADPKSPRLLHVWTVDPSRTYVLIRYQVFARARPEFPKEPRRLVAELTNEDWSSEDGLVLPRLVRWSRFRIENEVPVATLTSRVTVTRYKLGSEENTRDSLSIVWPLGSHVVDERTKTAIHVQSQAQILSDDTLAQAAAAAGVHSRSIDRKPEISSRSPAVFRLILINVAAVLAFLGWVLYRRRPVQ